MRRGLGPDEQLIPILSHRTFLELIPNASLVGLTLRGKQWEVKGVIKDRVGDEVSQAKASEDLEMIRDLLYPDETEEKDTKSK